MLPRASETGRGRVGGQPPHGLCCSRLTPTHMPPHQAQASVSCGVGLVPSPPAAAMGLRSPSDRAEGCVEMPRQSRGAVWAIQGRLEGEGAAGGSSGGIRWPLSAPLAGVTFGLPCWPRPVLHLGCSPTAVCGALPSGPGKCVSHKLWLEVSCPYCPSMLGRESRCVQGSEGCAWWTSVSPRVEAGALGGLAGACGAGQQRVCRLRPGARVASSGPSANTPAFVNAALIPGGLAAAGPSHAPQRRVERLLLG